MPATINGTSGFGGNLTGNVTGNADTATTATGLVNASGSAPVYGCRAWVNFDGTRNATNTGASTNGANVLIRASGNVSSVLKNGTGDYTITFTTGMPNTNYAVCATHSTTGTSTNAMIAYELNSGFRSTTQVRIANGDNQLDTFNDPTGGISVAIFC